MTLRRGFLRRLWALPALVSAAPITGSSRGIGRGIALKLAEDQVKVTIHYYKNEKAAGRRS